MIIVRMGDNDALLTLSTAVAAPAGAGARRPVRARLSRQGGECGRAGYDFD